MRWKEESNKPFHVHVGTGARIKCLEECAEDQNFKEGCIRTDIII